MASNTSARVVPVAVNVTVSVDGIVSISCSPNPVPVQSTSSLLSFTLATSGWRFRQSQAIALDSPNADFPYNSWTMSETNATLYDLNNTNADFAYTVTVINTTTGQEYSVDPVIRNGGSSGDRGD
jgi:hypothetical protein